ncbi:MAG: YdcF family protein [Hyphomonas sp.]|nr:YdcF family protein [Hyphomonas sp.]
MSLLLLFDAVVLVTMIVKAETATSRTPEWKEPVDALVVFFDRPGHFERVETAIEAIQTGHARNVLMVGGCRPQTGRVGARDMSEFALQAGISPGQVHTGAGSYHTRSNLDEALEIAKDHGWASIAFVSDPLHLVRIRDMAASDKALASLANGRAIASPYSGGSLTIVNRAHRELAYGAVSAVLPEPLLEGLVGGGRTGMNTESSINCSGGGGR